MQSTTDKYAAECSEDYRQYRKNVEHQCVVMGFMTFG